MQTAHSYTTPGSASSADNWQAGAAPDAFSSLVADLDSNFAGVAHGDWPAAARAAQSAIEAHIAKPGLLDGMRCVMRAAVYSRVLLHADPEDRFCVLGLIWPPGCATPIHAHVAWCALGLRSGILEEETYMVWRDGETEPGALAATRSMQPGETCCDPSEGRFVHRLLNRSPGFAMSLHVYGIPAERIADGVNRILKA